jgi:hypothetical protein
MSQLMRPAAWRAGVVLAAGPAIAVPGWLVVASALVASPAGASDANEHPYGIGELASTMGGAAVAVVRDGSAPWHNPAGLGFIEAEGISANASVYGLQLEKRHDFHFGGDVAGKAVLLFPNSVSYLRPLGVSRGGLRHALGVSIVVPDYERSRASADEHVSRITGDDGSIEGQQLNVRTETTEQTVWVMPGWGGCVGARWCFGVAAGGAYWTYVNITSLFGETYGTAAGGGSTRGYQLYHTDLWALGMVAQFGVQLSLSPRFRAGLVVRTPLVHLGGGGTYLHVDSVTSHSSEMPEVGRAEIRRFEEPRARVQHRLPAQVRAGIGYVRDALTIAADLRFSLPQATYPALRAADGEANLSAINPQNGEAEGDPLVFGRDAGRRPTLNGNLGARQSLSGRWSAQIGLFTDYAGTNQDDGTPGLHMDRYGLTVGIGRSGRLASTFAGLCATTASEEAIAGGPPARSSRVLLLIVSGSTKLSDD